MLHWQYELGTGSCWLNQAQSLRVTEAYGAINSLFAVQLIDGKVCMVRVQKVAMWPPTDGCGGKFACPPVSHHQPKHFASTKSMMLVKGMLLIHAASACYIQQAAGNCGS